MLSGSTRVQREAHRGTFFTRDGGFRALELLPDGSVLTVEKGCFDEQRYDEASHSWSRSGSSIQLSAADGAAAPDVLELASYLCGVHRLVREDGSDSDYVAGEYCRDDLIDWGHGGYACTWAPCDEAAEVCAEDG